MRRVLLFLVAFVALPLSALAATQPDGTPIPQRADLQTLYDGRADPINAVNDAAIVPERFSPGCRLNFTLVSRGGASFMNVFGWYNVTGAAPAPADLHVLIPCTAQAGFVASLDLRNEPAYSGGEIGFFLRTPEGAPMTGCAGGDCCATVTRPAGYTYYSERSFNPDNTGPTSSYIHLLVYDSRATPRAFYFAWEDLYGGGDNEFTDFVALVDNITCSGAGALCDTGLPGICSQGSQQCRAGALQCIPFTLSRTETCNGIDDNCDGMVDEGNLCAVGEVCDRGVCVGACVEGGCFVGSTCTLQGICVETACLAVTCPAGQRCVGGTCRGPCVGVVCPHGQTCRVGRCVDPCVGQSCDAEQVCADGLCVPRCQCRPCAAGQTCLADGRCVENACATVTCAAGQYCAGGTCMDACQGAMCPTGLVCTAGACTDPCATVRCAAGFRCNAGTCVAVPVMDAGTASDASADGMADGRIDGSADARGGATRAGCACEVRRAGPERGGWRMGMLVGMGALALAMRRRRGARRAKQGRTVGSSRCFDPRFPA